MWFDRFVGALTRAAGMHTRSVEPVESDGLSVLPPTRSGSGWLSLDTALTLPTVYRAVTILATAAGQLSLGVWRGDREVVPTPAIAATPDVYLTRSSFTKRTVIGLAGTGNAYWRHFLDPRGVVVNLEALNPLGVSIETQRDGRKLYHYSDPYRPAPQTFTEAQVTHLRLLEVPGHVLGLGPIQACRSSLSGALDLRDYADNWFSEAAIPTGVLTTQSQLTPDQAEAYKARWKETQATRDVAVLGQGLTYSPIILNPSDAQFLESQQFAVTDIARLFGIPAAYLLAEVNGSSMTYSNLEQADTQFLRYTLMSYLSVIEGALSRLLPRGQEARFKVDDLLRPDSKTRAEIDRIYVDLGVIVPNEVRRGLGRDPIPGGDEPRPRATAPAPTAPEVAA